MAFCKATNKNGEPCRAMAMSDSDYCYRHNPNISDEEKLQASATGGAKLTKQRIERQVATAQDNDIRSLNGIVDLIDNNIRDVRQGNVDPRISNAIVQNLNVLLKVYELGIQDARIRKLEEKAGIESPTELLSMGGN